jgi:PAS domain S-box-containing protein
LEAALRLKPATKHVVVVGGMSPVNRRHNGLAKQQLQAYENGLDISYLTQVTMPELLERLKTLPDDSIVIFTSFTVDAAGKRFIAATEAVPMIIAASRAPVFSLFDLFLSHGEVGGKVSSVEGNGRLLGELALKSFRGEKSVAPSRGVSRYMFDRRALQRWKLSEKDLPPGSIVIHGQPTTWELYRSYIVAAVSLILVEAFLITALLRQRKKRRLAESELRLALLSVRESEQRFRLVANSAPVLIWMSGPDKLCNYFNQGWLDFTGQTLESQLGAGWTDGIHSDDRKNCLETYESSFDGRQPFRLAYRLRRHDGEYRWVLDTGVPVYEPDGTFNGYIGSCVDITDSKRAEEALASVGHRLIEAHEEERSRIARELHDDINQQMAMIAIEIDRLSQALPEGAQQVRDQVAQIQLRIQEVGKDIQSLSHRLHSSKLDLLGLAGAAKSFCQEMSEKHKIEIDLHEEGTLRTSQETGLCLFRVLQEALHNAVKYSDAKTFKVELIEKDAFVHLMVKDSGAGFNQQHLADHPGLGLISMRERIQMVGGEFLIESELGEGTTVRATVPSHSTPPTARKATRNAILKAG